MDAPHFDALTHRLTIGLSRRRGLGLLAALGLRGLVAPDPAVAKKKKKRCPPCKKRKKGKCKGALPDGTPCPGGSCQGGACRADPCPGQKLCEGACIPTDQCCTVEDCPATEGDLCCNGECTFDKLETGEPCPFQDACCSNYCQQVFFGSSFSICAATCRGRGCGQDSDCCRGLRCEQVGPLRGCGGCLDTAMECDSDADCCFSACTAPPGAPKVCLSYSGGPCHRNSDCWSCFLDGECTIPLTGSRPVCHEGVCGCPYQCCSPSDCPINKLCVFDENGLNGECKPIIGP